MSYTRKSGGGRREYSGKHRLEHWYRDNQVYFLTARCRDRTPAFADESAKQVFWDRFDHYTQMFSFTPWASSLLDNHYHVIGYLRSGENLGLMMQRLHGSVAKLVNDILESKATSLKRGGPKRLVPFWRQSSHHDYFDGCIRDEQQLRLAYRYTLMQAMRHGIVRDWREYRHTRITIELKAAVEFTHTHNAYLTGVRYKRYMK